jgi:FkbM family methyltransferase
VTGFRSLLKATAYGTLDLVTAGRGVRRTVNGEPYRFPARWCRYYPAVYEPETAAFLRAHCKPGDVALDIGAHIGLFSVLMARLVGQAGRVFSFEPTPLTRAVLEQTVRLNDAQGVIEVRGEAVSRTTGTASFHDAGAALGAANSLVPIDRPDAGPVIPVPTIRVDDFVRERGVVPRCLKIDAEGAELDVLLGAERALTAARPVADLALHPAALARAGGSLKQLWDVLRDYRMGVVRDGGAVTEDWFCRQDGLFNVHLIPA